MLIRFLSYIKKKILIHFILISEQSRPDTRKPDFDVLLDVGVRPRKVVAGLIIFDVVMYISIVRLG